MDYYKECKKAYLGIDNIHTMRDSLNKVIEALGESEALAASVSGDLPGTNAAVLPVDRQALRRSGWLRHQVCNLGGHADHRSECTRQPFTRAYPLLGWMGPHIAALCSLAALPGSLLSHDPRLPGVNREGLRELWTSIFGPVWPPFEREVLLGASGWWWRR
jgi:hypothetical protein